LRRFLRDKLRDTVTSYKILEMRLRLFCGYLERSGRTWVSSARSCQKPKIRAAFGGVVFRTSQLCSKELGRWPGVGRILFLITAILGGGLIAILGNG